ncbi:hypothetical protein [Bacillus thuringiensis]|uniref:hypothetical protein n=1 Tax=Bacillus thuringiensis TaxID=1428 RepID=UPI00298C5F77|nr:hypothetical protein [Bacillus thuringiensis]
MKLPLINKFPFKVPDTSERRNWVELSPSKKFASWQNSQVPSAPVGPVSPVAPVGPVSPVDPVGPVPHYYWIKT